MLKTYNSLDEVPEALREHYVMKGGRVVPEVSQDHPLVVNNVTLKTEKAEAERQRDEANRKKGEAETALASANVLPRGHKAVPNADAELLEAVKANGLTTADDIKRAAESVTTLRTREKQDALREEAKKHGYDPEKVVALEDRFPEPLYRDVTENGKTERRAYFKVKDGEREVERTFLEHLSSDSKLKPLGDSLKASGGGTRVHGTAAGGGSAAQTVYDRHVKEVEEKYGKGDGKPRQTWQQSLGIGASN